MLLGIKGWNGSPTGIPAAFNMGPVVPTFLSLSVLIFCLAFCGVFSFFLEFINWLLKLLLHYNILSEKHTCYKCIFCKLNISMELVLGQRNRIYSRAAFPLYPLRINVQVLRYSILLFCHFSSICYTHRHTHTYSVFTSVAIRISSSLGEKREEKECPEHPFE